MRTSVYLNRDRQALLARTGKTVLQVVDIGFAALLAAEGEERREPPQGPDQVGDLLDQEPLWREDGSWEA